MALYHQQTSWALDREYATTDRPNYHRTYTERALNRGSTHLRSRRARVQSTAGSEGKSGQWRPLPDEGKLHKNLKSAAAVMNNYMTRKWHQIHHGWHPSCILPLDLKIHLKIVKQNMNT